MPVYSSHLLDYSGLGVGRRIREERQSKRLTLRQLAERLNVSEAKLSNIETAKASLDLRELSVIARALDVALAALFPKTTVQHYLIRRGTDVSKEPPTMRELIGPEPGPAKHHNQVWSLAELFVGKHMEPLFVRVAPLANKDMHFIAHDHEEFMFVLDGEVETLLKTNDGLVTERLQAGDGMYFRSNLPHCHRSTRAEPAETLSVIYSLRGAIDPHDGELASAGRRYYRRGVYADAAREASEKIGLLRRSHGMTLADLATDVGVGTRQLAQIESGIKAPDVDLLLRLARRFRRPIEYFFATTVESQPYYFIQRGAAIKDVPAVQRRSVRAQRGGAGANIFQPLASGFADKGMLPYYVQVMASPSEVVTPHEHAGEEFIYVLEGEIALVTDDGGQRVELLHAGDSLFIDSSVPHLLRGHSRNPYASKTAEIIDIFWTPFGENYLFQPGADSPLS